MDFPKSHVSELFLHSGYYISFLLHAKMTYVVSDIKILQLLHIRSVIFFQVRYEALRSSSTVPGSSPVLRLCDHTSSPSSSWQHVVETDPDSSLAKHLLQCERLQAFSSFSSWCFWTCCKDHSVAHDCRSCKNNYFLAAKISRNKYDNNCNIRHLCMTNYFCLIRVILSPSKIFNPAWTIRILIINWQRRIIGSRGIWIFI